MDSPFIEAPTIPDWLTEEYPFKRRMVQLGEQHMHFVDEGEGPVVLMMHGNPTWSFLWRKVIKLLLAQGYRVIAPDMIGLGLSSKPRQRTYHSLDQHAENLLALVEALDLQEMTIVGQDWGGPIISGMAARAPERVRAAVWGNTSVLAPAKRIKATAFHRFANRPVVSDIAFRLFNFPVPVMHKVQGDPASIAAFEKKAYTYPLRKVGDRVAPLALARMVPNAWEHPTVKMLQRSDAWAREFKGPVQLVWGMRDPILGRSLKRMQEAFPQASTTETQAGHFLQEEVPEELAKAICEVQG